MRIPAALTSIHKWVGLVIGIQVVLWVAGGLVMSAFPIELVRGETQAAPQQPTAIAAEELGIDLREALAAHGPVTGLRTIRIAGKLHVEALRADGPPLLIDAQEGRVLDGIDEATARAVAARDFTGDGGIVAAALLAESPGEYRGALPVWQLRFDDARDTVIYVSAQNGQVVARRNDVWRLYDFFWMLHIMDYKERVDFNHALLIGASALALVLSATGFWLLFYRIRIRRGR
ncbi:MAG: PepSY domain-containing protein [Steroidobacteraceae bacterium]|nr:PepSY domain-containing protein [Steroidobacteraceae bacterium]